ncbi:MAG: S-layer homology domain-containing protein [Clostridia bacterium]|nr:S-layer homology domain-containing protein [Clostridia bacterium]
MKRIISTLLAICLVFTLCMPVMAAGMGNFVQYNMYDNNFTDVASEHWAMPSIKACYEYALMYGSSNTKFNPSGELTVAEALVMADRVHSIYNTGETAVFSGTPWYKPYVDYAVNKGIVSASDFSDVTLKITRAQMAYVFYNALPEKEFTAINSIKNVPDVDGEHKFHTEIKALYNAGILTGSDAFGTFYPDKNITRAEAAAIISRVVDVKLRKTFTITEPLSANEIKDKCSPAVALVQGYDADGKTVSSGSGFFTDGEGTLITAIDCVKGAVSVKVKTADKREYAVESVYDCDAPNNLVLLKTTCENTAFLEIDTSSVKANEQVFAIYSFAGNTLFAEGDVSGPADSNRIMCNVNVPSSAIGAVAVNKYGKVIGVKDASSVFSAIPAEYAKNLVKGNPLPIEKFAEFLESESVLYTTKNKVTVSQHTYGQSLLVNFSPVLRDHITITTDVADIVELTEIKYISDHEIMLTLSGKNKGRTTVSVAYTFEPVSNKKCNILVTSGSPEGEPDYYAVGAPSYSSITGIPCEYSYMVETGMTYDYYEDGAAIYGYDYYAPSEPDSYMKALKANGWAYSETASEGDTVANFFIKGNYRIGVNVDHATNTVYIVFYVSTQNTYKNGAPTYHDYTGEECLYSYFVDTQDQLPGYHENADVYFYEYTRDTPVSNYMSHLQDEGWVFSNYNEDEADETVLYVFDKGNNRIGVEIDYYYFIVSIYVIKG